MNNLKIDRSTNQRFSFTLENRKDVSANRFSQSFKEYVCEFCESVSIQGLAYIVKNVSFLERIWWIIVFTAGISGSCFMVNNLLDKWITTPILVSLATQESKISDIPFPAVTICPEAKISRKCLNYTKVLQERMRGDISFDMKENLYFDLMAVFCKSENHNGTGEILQNFLDSLTEGDPEYDISSSVVFKEVAIDDYKEFLTRCSAVHLDNATCKWMGRTMECKEVMVPVITDEGLCYTFNMYDVRDIYSDVNAMDYFPESRHRRRDWDPEQGYQKKTNDLEDMYPRRAFQIGANNGFTAIFMTEKKEINYACRDLSLQGIRVSLHSPTRLPRPGQVFFSVGLNRLTTAAVTPSLTSTAKIVQAYDPDKRSCYFGHERKLEFFKYYSQSNCNLECWTNYTRNHCGCVNFYMPRDRETKICNLEKRFCLKDARKSYTKDILMERLKPSGIGSHTGKTAECHCLPLCGDLTYNAEITTSKWDFNNKDEASFDDVRDEISQYHSSAVKVFFKDNYFLPTRRSELYGTTDLISNIGGTLGLFMGFSLITLGEIIYFLSVRLIENYRKYGNWAGPRNRNEQ